MQARRADTANSSSSQENTHHHDWKPRERAAEAPRATPRDWVLLVLLAAAAFLVHGYHPGAEDAEIYLPQIKKLLHPALYPFGAEFFETHARMTLFPQLIAWPVKLLHAPLAGALLAWHLATIFLLLLVCWKISARMWRNAAGRWGAVALVGALLTIPVAGTQLYILDQYVNPRSISTFAILFAIDAALGRRYGLAAIWLILTGLVHPLMAAFGVLFVALLAFEPKRVNTAMIAAALVWPGFLFARPPAAWWQCLNDHAAYHLLRWEWYEWLGILAPLLIFWWLLRFAARERRAEMRRVAQAIFIFGAICLAAALVVMIPQRFERFAMYQPLRGFQLVYIFLFLIAGGLLGEKVLKRGAMRWLALFLPLCAGMFCAQLGLFPGNRHIEWPGAAAVNPWLQSFAWIRVHTPEGAVFAMDPNYMALPGEDQQGFRAMAERSSLADAHKDWSAAVMFPGVPLADECLRQIRAASPWNPTDAAELLRLKQVYGVSWILSDAAHSRGLACPYRNGTVAVCELR